jgi:hypothetical protein
MIKHKQVTQMKSILKALYPHKELIIRRYLILRLLLIIEINPGNPTIGINLYPLRTLIFSAKGLLTIILQIKDNLVPSLIEFEGHGTLEGFYSRYGLVVGGDEGSLGVLVV